SNALAQARQFSLKRGISRSSEDPLAQGVTQPMGTVIMESKDLDSMALATIFVKLQEHEMDLVRLTLHEESDKCKKGISLKASTSQDQEDKDDD
ncbi:hypothetical protein Lal_00024463, partial [Lupinus albus]